MQKVTKADIERMVTWMETAGRRRGVSGGKPGTGLGPRSVQLTLDRLTAVRDSDPGPDRVHLARGDRPWCAHRPQHGAAEGVNRLIKLVYRGAFGFTNVSNQQRRSRYIASRSTRPEWLHTVTRSLSLPVAT
jgi:hypothetical protein